MAATPDPQPDHPLVRGLDEVFTGKGGTHPRWSVGCPTWHTRKSTADPG